MRRYKPGRGVRSSLVSTLLGIYTDPSSPSANMHTPDGATVSATPVQDSVGNWHADFDILLTCPPGIGVFRWQSTGASPTQNALAEERFVVEPLDF